VFDFDFYLQAHAGLEGHVHTMHYTVIYDENGMSADEIQVATHNTSYLYARATRAVSLIPAAYYADLACRRGRCYLNDLWMGVGTDTAGGDSTVDWGERSMEVFEAAKKSWGDGVSRTKIWLEFKTSVNALFFYHSYMQI